MPLYDLHKSAIPLPDVIHRFYHCVAVSFISTYNLGQIPIGRMCFVPPYITAPSSPCSGCMTGIKEQL